MKRVIALLLAIMLVAGVMPMAVHAEGECAHSSGYYQGKCKDCKTPCTHPSYSGGKFGTAGKCDVCKMNCTHSGPQTIQVTNCNNGSGKYGKTICACGYYTQGIVGEGVPHNFGENEPNCLTCGAVNIGYIPPCTSHVWGEDGVCTNAGCTAIKPCESHNYGTDGVCTNKGCSAVCGHTNMKTNKAICGSGGYTTTFCPKAEGGCGYVQSTELAPAEHTWGADNTCTYCGTKKPADPCTSHVWGADGKCTNEGCTEKCSHPEEKWQVVYKDCIESDYDHVKCLDCGMTFNTAYEKERNTHSYDDTTKKCTYCGADKPAEQCKHTEWDWTTGTCAACGEPCPGHEYKDIHPNCVTGGNVSHKCKTCGYTYIDNTPKPAGSHSFDATTGICSVCGQQKPDDCTHQWNKGTCTLCGAVCGHEDKIINNNATCTESGYHTVKCDCGLLEITAVNPLGHEYENGKCIRCGAKQPVSSGGRLPDKGLDDVPRTGDDRATIFVSVLTVMLLGVGAYCITKKEMFES